MASGLLSALKSKLRRRRGAHSPSPPTPVDNETITRSRIKQITDTVVKIEAQHDLLNFVDIEHAKTVIGDMILADLYGHIILNSVPTSENLVAATSRACKTYRRGLCILDTSRWPS